MNTKDKIAAAGMECMVGWASEKAKVIHYLGAVALLSVFFIF